MGACDWLIPGLTSLPRGAISLREEGWRASALGAAGAPEAAGALSAGALSSRGMPSERAAGVGAQAHRTGSRVERAEGVGGREGGNWAGAAGLGSGSQCVCVSVGPLWLSTCARGSGSGARSGPRPAGSGTWGPPRGSGGGEGRPVSLFGYLAV